MSSNLKLSCFFQELLFLRWTVLLLFTMSNQIFWKIAMFEYHCELMRREVNLEWDPPETDAAQETPIFGLPATSQMRAGQNFFEGFSEDMEKWS